MVWIITQIIKVCLKMLGAFSEAYQLETQDLAGTGLVLVTGALLPTIFKVIAMSFSRSASHFLGSLR